MSLLLGWVLLGMACDLWSCYLFLARNRRGYGPSGQPAVTFIICYMIHLVWTQKSVFTESAWIDGYILLLFHYVVLFSIPISDKNWREKQKLKNQSLSPAPDPIGDKSSD